MCSQESRHVCTASAGEKHGYQDGSADRTGVPCGVGQPRHHWMWGASTAQTGCRSVRAGENMPGQDIPAVTLQESKCFICQQDKVMLSCADLP